MAHRIVIAATTKNNLTDTSDGRKGSLPFFVENMFEFPLKPYTKDVLLLQNPKVMNQLFNRDGKVFLEILEVSCIGNGDQDMTSKFGVDLPVELLNRLDRCQDAAPLHYACINGHKQVVAFLLDNGANVNIWDGQKRVTPLICAAAHGHVELVNMLLERGCDVNSGLNSPDQSSALLWAVKTNQPEIIPILLSHNATDTSTVLYSLTPAHAAVMIGSPQIMEMLLGHTEPSKVDVYMGPRRDTPLHLASRGKYPNSLETCKLLLQKGNVNVNAVNASGKTALHLASAARNADIIKQLLSHWACVDIQDKDGRTPLFHTISDAPEALNSLETLIVRGKCNINHQDKYGYTSLHLAASEGAEGAAEILLMSGADFSLKAIGGVSALSFLQRKIPNVPDLLRKVFDNAVTISPQINPNDIQGNTTGGRQDCKIKVNFKCVLPSTPATSFALGDNPAQNVEKTTRYPRMAKLFTEKDNEDENESVRKETAKIKCLVDEGLSGLLLHPVIHAFLEMKWQKAWPILLPAVLFKIACVLLFSVYVELPHWFHGRPTIIENGTTPTPAVIPDPSNVSRKVLLGFSILYYFLVAMVALKGLMEFANFLRAPKAQWRSVDYWMSLTILLILILCMKPRTWVNTPYEPFNRSLAALGILLAWIDIWISMSRFPKIGLSIRVFFQVFQNFAKFILPHFCLLAGFTLSLTILVPGNGEYTLPPLTFTKLTRVMAGDITITAEGSRMLKSDSTYREYTPHFLFVYIYTAFVLMVSIVLMNLLIGLAVNDIQGIYAEASINKLIKQTLMLNALESNFKARLLQLCLSKKFLESYVNLFKTGSQNKIIVFKPCDSRDQKVSNELKQALLDIDKESCAPSTNNTLEANDDELQSSSPVRVWKNAANKLVRGKEEEGHKIVVDKINELISAYLVERNSRTTST